MLPRNDPDRIQIAFDDQRLVANSGCFCRSPWPTTWGWASWWRAALTWEMHRVGQMRGDKLMTLVASALAGGDCIDDADALRAGETEQVLGYAVKAPSTLGTFLRSFRWGHMRQLDRVSREVLARAWGAGAGPGDEPLTIDLDSIRRRRTRLTVWPRKAHSVTTMPANGAITRSSLLSLERATC